MKKRKAAESSTAVVPTNKPIHPLRRTWVYIVVDRNTGVVVYVGKTVSLARRWREHVKKTDEELTRLVRWSNKKGYSPSELTAMFCVVPQFADGVAHKDALEIEAHLISKHKTLWTDDEERPNATNMNNGARADTLDRAKIEDWIENGYEWPERPHDDDADGHYGPEHAAAAFHEAVLDDLHETIKTLPGEVSAAERKEVSRALVAAKKKREAFEVFRMPTDTPFLKARSLLDTYREMLPSKVVDRQGFESELNSELIHLAKTDEYKKVIEAYLAQQKGTFSDGKQRFKGIPMTAKEAVAVLQLTCIYLGRCEELLVEEEYKDFDAKPAGHGGRPFTNHLERAREWKTFAETNNGALPKTTQPRDASGNVIAMGNLDDVKQHEVRLGATMRDWLDGRGGPSRPHLHTYLVVMRDVDLFWTKVRGGMSVSHDKALNLNHAIRSGLSLRCLHGDRDPIPHNCLLCGSPNPAQSFARTILAGCNKDKHHIVFRDVDAVTKQVWLDEITRLEAVKKQEETAKRQERDSHAAGLMMTALSG